MGGYLRYAAPRSLCARHLGGHAGPHLQAARIRERYDIIAARIEGRRPEKRGAATYAAGIGAEYIKIGSI